MTLLTISAAAKAWGVSRPRLYQLKEAGKLSFTQFEDGRPALDTAELLRVLGEPGSRRKGVSEQVNVAELLQQQTTLTAAGDAVIQERLDNALERLADSQQQLADAREREGRLLSLLENMTRQLEHQQTAGVQPAPPLTEYRGLWGFLTKPRRLF